MIHGKRHTHDGKKQSGIQKRKVVASRAERKYYYYAMILFCLALFFVILSKYPVEGSQNTFASQKIQLFTAYVVEVLFQRIWQSLFDYAESHIIIYEFSNTNQTDSVTIESVSKNPNLPAVNKHKEQTGKEKTNIAQAEILKLEFSIRQRVGTSVLISKKNCTVVDDGKKKQTLYNCSKGSYLYKEKVPLQEDEIQTHRDGLFAIIKIDKQLKDTCQNEEKVSIKKIRVDQWEQHFLNTKSSPIRVMIELPTLDSNTEKINTDIEAVYLGNNLLQCAKNNLTSEDADVLVSAVNLFYYQILKQHMFLEKFSNSEDCVDGSHGKKSDHTGGASSSSRRDEQSQQGGNTQGTSASFSSGNGNAGPTGNGGDDPDNNRNRRIPSGCENDPDGDENNNENEEEDDVPDEADDENGNTVSRNDRRHAVNNPPSRGSSVQNPLMDIDFVAEEPDDRDQDNLRQDEYAAPSPPSAKIFDRDDHAPGTSGSNRPSGDQPPGYKEPPFGDAGLFPDLPPPDNGPPSRKRESPSESRPMDDWQGPTSSKRKPHPLRPGSQFFRGSLEGSHPKGSTNGQQASQKRRLPLDPPAQHAASSQSANLQRPIDPVTGLSTPSLRDERSSPESTDPRSSTSTTTSPGPSTVHRSPGERSSSQLNNLEPSTTPTRQRLVNVPEILQSDLPEEPDVESPNREQLDQNERAADVQPPEPRSSHERRVPQRVPDDRVESYGISQARGHGPEFQIDPNARVEGYGIYQDQQLTEGQRAAAQRHPRVVNLEEYPGNLVAHNHEHRVQRAFSQPQIPRFDVPRPDRTFYHPPGPPEFICRACRAAIYLIAPNQCPHCEAYLCGNHLHGDHPCVQEFFVNENPHQRTFVDDEGHGIGMENDEEGNRMEQHNHEEGQGDESRD